MKDHVALLLKKDNMFLFIKRSKNKKTLPGIWAFPSGTVEIGENIYETAKREADEELGIKIDVHKVLTVKELNEFNVRLHFLICEIISGFPFIKDRNEIEEISWMTFSQFFNKYNYEQIGHGLIFLRENPNIWQEYI